MAVSEGVEVPVLGRRWPMPWYRTVVPALLLLAGFAFCYLLNRLSPVDWEGDG